MASDYLPGEIEKKWQERWAAEKLYQVRDDGRMVGGVGVNRRQPFKITGIACNET